MSIQEGGLDLDKITLWGGIVNQAQQFAVNNMNAFFDRCAWMQNWNAAKNAGNLYDACNYPKTLTLRDYKSMFDRNGVAARLVKVYAAESWMIDPDIFQVENPTKTTRWERRLEDLIYRFNLLSSLEHLDWLSVIGQCGIAVIGCSDTKDGDLSKPVQGTDSEGVPDPALPLNEMLFIRPLDQTQFTIKSLDPNKSSLNYGLPEYYSIVNPASPSLSRQFTGDTSASDPVQGQDVHYTRVLHYADNVVSCPYLGIPKMQQNYNRLLDIEKMLGANAEGFYRSGFPGISVETHPNDDSLDDIDEDDVKKQLELYQRGLKRSLLFRGLTAKTLTPSVTDPTAHIRAPLELITASEGIPFRVFMGSEEAKVAGDEDTKRWNGRLHKRRTKHLSFYAIGALMNRLASMRILPQVRRFYSKWPDPSAPSQEQKVDISSKIVVAMSNYVQHGCSSIMEVIDFLQLMHFPLDQAQRIVEAVKTRTGIEFKTNVETVAERVATTTAKARAAQKQPGKKRTPSNSRSNVK